MSMQMTRKELKQLAKSLDMPIYGVRYGYLPFPPALPEVKEIGYNAGVYGWNWTAYIYEGAIWCHGYRNLVRMDKED